jgi:hypothetical protein
MRTRLLSDNYIYWKFLCIKAFILWKSQFMGNVTQTKIKIYWKHIILGCVGWREEEEKRQRKKKRAIAGKGNIGEGGGERGK